MIHYAFCAPEAPEQTHELSCGGESGAFGIASPGCLESLVTTQGTCIEDSTTRRYHKGPEYDVFSLEDMRTR